MIRSDPRSSDHPFNTYTYTPIYRHTSHHSKHNASSNLKLRKLRGTVTRSFCQLHLGQDSRTSNQACSDWSWYSVWKYDIRRLRRAIAAKDEPPVTGYTNGDVCNAARPTCTVSS